MLQQTTVKAVGPYYARFLARWPTVGRLAAASLDDVLRAWAGLGYYARARNLHACAKEVVQRHGGHSQREPDPLRALPGIGDYTAAAIAAIAFDVRRCRSTEMSNVWCRVCSRLTRNCRLPNQGSSGWPRRYYRVGAAVISRKPSWILEPPSAHRNARPAYCVRGSNACAAYVRGDQETFPRKAPKREGQLRRGAAYVALRADGRVLLRKRPDKGLLASMTEVPGSAWANDFNEKSALRSAPRLKGAKWKRVPGVVRHVFTHFPLELAVFLATVTRPTKAPTNARWAPLASLAGEALPNVMRKVIVHALDGDRGGKHGRRRG